MKKEILLLIIVLTLLFICFGIGYKRGRSSIDIKQDTVFVEKVITQYKPNYKNEQPIGFQKVKLPTFVIFSELVDSSKHTVDKLKYSLDSLKYCTDSLELELQRVQRYYSEDNYEVWVSGIDPVLDSIKIKQQIQQITNTHAIEKETFKLNAGLNADGWNRTSWALNPNINASYDINRITITGEVGFHVPLKNTSATIPYFQVGINYSLWSF